MSGHIDLFFSNRLSPTPRFYQNLLSKMCPNLYLPSKLAKICWILTVWPLFWSFHWMTPFLRRKFSHWKTHIFKLLNPSHFQSRVPPSPWVVAATKWLQNVLVFSKSKHGKWENTTWMASYLFTTKFLGWWLWGHHWEEEISSITRGRSRGRHP